MTQTTTIPTQNASALAITIEDDAPPLVRLVGRRLHESVRVGHALDVLRRGVGTVALRSHDTPQAATIAFDGPSVIVTSGVHVESDATVVVDLNARFAAPQEPEGDAVLAADVLRALTPPLPPWRTAAERFWDAARPIAGIPDVLVVEVQDRNGAERAEFGVGVSTYLMAGPSDLLAGVFTGADDFLAALAAGLQVKGTLSQLSVMTAASWKVRFDV